MAKCTCKLTPTEYGVGTYGRDRDPHCSVHGDRAQPLPTPRPELQSAHEAVKALLAERLAFGIEKYHTPLTAFNGRNSAQDALEEAMDGAVYAHCALVERSVMIKLLLEATASVRSGTLREDIITCLNGIGEWPPR